MDISKHIRNYLSEHLSVIVPGLGRFTAVDKPSEIRNGLVVPPVRTVEYNSADDIDDGLLTAYIAQQENISVEQARSETAAFYESLKNKLAGRKTIMLDQFGTLSVNEIGDIVFEPDANLFIERMDSYGLGAINLQGGTVPQPQPAVTPPSIITPPPVTFPPVAEPVFTPPSATPEPVAPKTQPATDSSLFATENMRVRENTERRKPAVERQEPPVKPAASTAPPPLKKKPEPKKKASSGGGFPMWVLLVLLIAAGLGAAGYFFYPKLAPYIDSTISSIKGDKKTAQPELASQPVAGTEQDTPNPEVAQTLDEATEKKNALNPASESTPQPATQPQAKPAVTQTPPAQPVTKPQPQPAATVASTPGSVGAGKYLLIVGSFTTQASAEKFGKQLRDNGINYEIIDFGNGRVRVAVASFNSETEAANQVKVFKSKPYCEGAWVTKR